MKASTQSTTRPSQAPQAASTQAVEWDFSKNHDRSTVNWPSNIRGKYYDLSDVNVKIKLANGQLFEANRAAHVYCRAEGEYLEEVTVDNRPEPLSAACDHAQSIMTQWSLLRGPDLSAWKKAAAAGDLNSFAAAGRRDASPILSISLISVPVLDDPPQGHWHLMFEIWWRNDPTSTSKPAATIQQ